MKCYIFAYLNSRPPSVLSGCLMCEICVHFPCSFLRFSRNSICRNDICRTKPQVIPYVMDGLILALRECQNQFKNRRWNCTEKNGSIEKIMRHGNVFYIILSPCMLDIPELIRTAPMPMGFICSNLAFIFFR
jgi:hypothetical protein